MSQQLPSVRRVVEVVFLSANEAFDLANDGVLGNKGIDGEELPLRMVAVDGYSRVITLLYGYTGRKSLQLLDGLIDTLEHFAWLEAPSSFSKSFPVVEP